MNRTKIPWADWSWNPISGCSAISEGCENCYAEAMARRFEMPWGRPIFNKERLDQPMWVRKPSRIFVCSMADLYHENVPADWLLMIYESMSRAPQHTYILLTKRPQNAVKCPPPEDCWFGITAENQNRFDERMPIASTIPAAVHFVSVEPMLEPVSTSAYPVDWVICGPENGLYSRPFRATWLEMLSAENACFFDKRDGTNLRREFPYTRNWKVNRRGKNALPDSI